MGVGLNGIIFDDLEYVTPNLGFKVTALRSGISRRWCESSIVQSTVVDYRARPKPCKNGVVAEFFLLKALECVLYQSVIEIKPNTFSPE